MRPVDLSSPGASTLFHIGFVVHDLGDAMASLARATGVRWNDVRSAVMEIETPRGNGSEVSLRYVFSDVADGSLAVELVESAPGTLWQPTPSGIHHVGHWSSDVDRDSQQLLGGGHQLVVRGRMAGATSWMFAYHQTDAGLLELVDESRKQGLSRSSA